MKQRNEQFHYINVHPGEILEKEFLKPLKISSYRLSKATGIPESRISQIISGKVGISASVALKLGKFFQLPASFWLGLQMDYELMEETFKLNGKLEAIKPYTELQVA
jgi:antitoxin HigA-1